jgi:hypothetical protein
MADQQKIKQTETEIYRHEGRRWPALILLLVAALLIAVAVTLLGRWIYREISGSEDKSAGTSSDSAGLEGNGAQQAAPAETSNPSEGEGNGGSDTADSDDNSEVQGSQTVPATGDEGLPSTGG